MKNIKPPTGSKFTILRQLCNYIPAKCHLRLDLQSFLPGFVLVTKAGDADPKRAREVCAGVHAGEIVLFDKAYLDYAHLMDLESRHVIWVTRAKENLEFVVQESRTVREGGKTLSDEIVRVRNAGSRAVQVFFCKSRSDQGEGWVRESMLR